MNSIVELTKMNAQPKAQNIEVGVANMTSDRNRRAEPVRPDRLACGPISRDPRGRPMGHLLCLSWYRSCWIRNTKERCGRGDRTENTCTHFIAANLPLSPTTVIPMAESDASISDHDFGKQPQRIPGYKDPAGKV